MVDAAGNVRGSDKQIKVEPENYESIKKKYLEKEEKGLQAAGKKYNVEDVEDLSKLLPAVTETIKKHAARVGGEAVSSAVIIREPTNPETVKKVNEILSAVTETFKQVSAQAAAGGEKSLEGRVTSTKSKTPEN